MRILTNGLLLNKYKKDIANLFDAVVISLDGSSKDTYRQIRGVDGLDLVIEGMSGLRALNKRIEIRVKSVIQKRNLKELRQIFSLAKRGGANKISFLACDMRNALAFKRDGHTSSVDNMLMTKKELQELKEELRIFAKSEKYSEKGFRVNKDSVLNEIYNYYKRVVTRSRPKLTKCNAPSFSIIIDCEGKVFPCFFSGPIGSIKSKKITSILQSKELADFAMMMKNGERKECFDCVCGEYIRSS